MSSGSSGHEKRPAGGAVLQAVGWSEGQWWRVEERGEGAGLEEEVRGWDERRMRSGAGLEEEVCVCVGPGVGRGVAM